MPRIIAEKYLHDDTQEELTDYKFFCFGGEPRLLQITSGKGNEKKVNYFDAEFNQINLSTDQFVADNELKKPANYTEMVEVARRLSQNIIHVRIDLYYINDKIYFGEYTFHNKGGIVNFTPPEWNQKLGELIHLPQQ